MASTSISVPMKQRKASSGVHTMGSPRTLKLVLTITDLVKRYPTGARALNGVSLAVDEPHVVAVIGARGRFKRISGGVQVMRCRTTAETNSLTTTTAKIDIRITETSCQAKRLIEA